MRRALEACTAALELKVKEAAAEQADMIASGLTSGKHQPQVWASSGLTCGTSTGLLRHSYTLQQPVQ